MDLSGDSLADDARTGVVARAGHVHRFAGWRYDAASATLSQRDATGAWQHAVIGSRALALLDVLLRSPGALISKDTLLDTVWPSVTVETNNLTVQIAALRRVLDAGRDGESCIQTVPGRGYRFVCPLDGPAAPDLPPAPAPDRPSAPRRFRARWAAGLAVLPVVVLTVLVMRHGVRPGPPPLSVMIAPFDSPGGSPTEASLAFGLTEDMTAGLSVWSGLVVARPERTRGSPTGTAAYRYRITGSVRRIADAVRVDAQLADVTRGEMVWADHFDLPSEAPESREDAAVARLSMGFVDQMVSAEVARGRRERPGHPTPADLVMQARELASGPADPQAVAASRALLEQALRLDPSSAEARLRLANVLLDDNELNPNGRKAVLERTRALLDETSATDRLADPYRSDRLHWLVWQDDRCRETVEAGMLYIASHPYAPGPYRWVASCDTRLGHSDLAVPLLQKIIAMEPQDSWRPSNYRNLANALFYLGRYDEAIDAARLALAAQPGFGPFQTGRLNRWIAASYALSGRLPEARAALADASRVWPYATLRWVATYEPWSPIYAAQVEKLRDGLRLAGLRDHADEMADFGQPATGRIHQAQTGPTPMTVPGATTIITPGLVRLLAGPPPLVIDTMSMEYGTSLPGAIGLRYVGEGGDLDDLAQPRLRARMQMLTHGDLSRPVVAVGFNAEHFDSRNLALRLVALGYTHVYWYRGGREAWQVNNLPEAPLLEQTW